MSLFIVAKELEVFAIDGKDKYYFLAYEFPRGLIMVLSDDAKISYLFASCDEITKYDSRIKEILDTGKEQSFLRSTLTQMLTDFVGDTKNEANCIGVKTGDLALLLEVE